MFGAKSAAEDEGRYETSAIAEVDCAPAQAPALNEWSSTPPVSRTTHALIFAACEAGATATPVTSASAATADKYLSVFFKIFPPEGPSP